MAAAKPAAKPVVEHIDIDAELEEEAPVVDMTGDGDGTVWLRSSVGEFHVEVGSPAYERLVSEGAQRIEDPTSE
jgi:hypothetical protein